MKYKVTNYLKISTGYQVTVQVTSGFLWWKKNAEVVYRGSVAGCWVSQYGEIADDKLEDTINATLLHHERFGAV